MCIEVLKNPVGAISTAKKSRNMGKVLLTLVEACIFIALVPLVSLASAGISEPYVSFALVTSLTIFVLVLVFSIITGCVLRIAATTLGGSGGYYEGLTVVSYSLVPVSLSILISAAFSLVPAGAFIGVIALLFGFSLGLSTIYRGVKDMFKTDMITSFVTVSVLVLVIFIAFSASTGLAGIAGIGSLIRGV